MPDAARLMDWGDVRHSSSLKAGSIAAQIICIVGLRTHSSQYSRDFIETQLKHA